MKGRTQCLDSFKLPYPGMFHVKHVQCGACSVRPEAYRAIQCCELQHQVRRPSVLNKDPEPRTSVHDDRSGVRPGWTEMSPLMTDHAPRSAEFRCRGGGTWAGRPIGAQGYGEGDRIRGRFSRRSVTMFHVKRARSGYRSTCVMWGDCGWLVIRAIQPRATLRSFFGHVWCDSACELLFSLTGRAGRMLMRCYGESAAVEDDPDLIFRVHLCSLAGPGSS